MTEVFVIIIPMKNKYLFILFCFIFLGCARILDTPKVIWGSSTRALENYRDTASVKSYNTFLNISFDEVLEIANDEELEVFINDFKKGVIVLMHIPGSGKTTEVGVFFTSLRVKETKIEIVSLSSIAQKTAADLIFSELDKSFSQTE